MMEVKTPAEIIERQRTQFANAHKIDNTVVAEHGTDRTYEQYLFDLPTLKGHNFEHYVDTEIERRMQEAEKTGSAYKKVRIMDIGYGGGLFLLGCLEKWGDKIEAIAYGSSYYPKQELQDNSGKTRYEELVEAGVHFIEGDMIDVRKNVPEPVDFLVSNQAMMYASYPEWEIVKKFYRVLSNSGMAFLRAGINLKIEGVKDDGRADRQISTYVAQAGIPFEVNPLTISFQRNPSIDIGALRIRSVRGKGKTTIRLG